MTKAAPSALDRARAGWGDAMPSFVHRIALACDLSSQAVMADALGISRTALSQVISNKYPGTPKGLPDRVDALCPPLPSVECPIMGRIGSKLCDETRALAYCATNSKHINQFRACRQCERKGIKHV